MLEEVLGDAQHDAGIHLDEAAVAVPGEAGIASEGSHASHSLVIETEVEDGVHHARHRKLGARTHRDQEWTSRIAQTAVQRIFHEAQLSVHFLHQPCRQGLVIEVIFVAGIGCDREPRGHTDTTGRHFGKPGTFAAECAAHALATGSIDGLASAKLGKSLVEEISTPWLLNSLNRVLRVHRLLRR
jgi:hypothetical protein